MDRDKVLESLRGEKIYALPEDIDFDTYAEVLEFLTIYKDDPVTIHCAGGGGSTDVAFAIVDLIRQHGAVRTALMGAAYSSHVIVFASGRDRQVSQHAQIGIHRPYFERVGGHAGELTNRAFYLHDLERQIAELFSDASKHSDGWWLDVIRSVERGGWVHYNSQSIISMGLAQPLS